MSGNDRGYQRIFDQILAYARGELGTRVELEQFADQPVIQELAAGLNMLGEELDDARVRIERIRQALAACNEVHDALQHGPSVTASLEQICRILHTQCGCDRVLAVCFNDDLHPAKWNHVGFDAVRTIMVDKLFQQGQVTPCLTQLSSNSPCAAVAVCEKLCAECALVEHNEGNQFDSVLVPLVDREQLLGALLLKVNLARSEDPEYRNMLTQIAASIAGALNRVLLEDRRKAASERYKIHREKYRALVEMTSDWVWEVDSEARYTYVSPKIEDLLGYEPHEVLGRTPFDLMPPEEAERIGATFAGIAESQAPFEALRNVNLHKDGHPVVLETSGVPVIDEHGELLGYRGIDRDISERDAAAEALRVKEEKWRSLVENSPDVVMQLDETGIIRYLNLQQSQHAVGESVYQHLTDDQRGKVRSALRQIFDDGQTAAYEIKAKGPDDIFHWYSTRASPIRDRQGKVVLATLVSREVTELVAAKQELEKKASLLESQKETLAKLNSTLREEMNRRQAMEAKLRLAQKLEAVGQLASGIAHEINTPIQYVVALHAQ